LLDEAGHTDVEAGGSVDRRDLAGEGVQVVGRSGRADAENRADPNGEHADRNGGKNC